MVAHKGNNFLLQVESPTQAGEYNTLMGLRSNDMTVSNTTVDTTHKGNDGWQSSLAGGGLKAVALTGAGIFMNDYTVKDVVSSIFFNNNARGSFSFNNQPVAGEELTINGVTVEFVDANAGNNQILLSEDGLEATLSNAVAVLNASTNIQIVKCIYFVRGLVIDVIHKASGASGNTFVLASDAATAVSLAGGSDSSSFQNFRIQDEDGATFTGEYHIESFTLAGEVNDVMTYEISLQSSGAVDYVAA